MSKNKNKKPTASTNAPTWEQIVLEALEHCGGDAPLSDLYSKVEKVCKQHHRPLTKHWKPKVRQVCQLSEKIVQDEPGSGQWRLGNGKGAKGESTQG